MCFSATASFGSAALLLVGGVLCTKHAIKNDKTYLLLAITPLFFALQQASEGAVWIGYNEKSISLTTASSILFLFFALFFWLTWLPIVAFSLEAKKWKKVFFVILIITGFVFGLYLWLPVLLESGPRHLIKTSKCGHGLCYIVSGGGLLSVTVRDIIYSSLGVLFLLSSNRLFRKFWALVMLLGVTTYFTQRETWVSTWCFFAAISTLWIYFLLINDHKAKMKKQAS
ncbi:hypothetical protein MO867_20610 [Microbulbifer sp. OS29]|uniref:Arginine/ornithine antiporter ArcD n=1 Tax=Microbulbifer okhotskensis TaxID=2926617 RepID=A0A9X2J6Z5_9GAMM|nr:DUF6629 family protein [Microbulbifer okhotskensis]MCO1336733.1 hypothetical protein [Microbulbifer okhotskensis]